MKTFTVNNITKVSKAISLSLFENSLVKSTLVCSTLALPLIMPSTLVHANDNTSVISSASEQQVNIAAGDLGTQLSRFAADNKLVIYFDASLTRGLKSKALQGEFSIEAALTKLLSGSELTFVKEADGAYRIVAESEKKRRLATTQINSYQESATSPVQGYFAKQTASASRFDTPIIETPQTISIVGANEITVRKAQSLSEALAYTAGVTTRGGPDKTSDDFMLRGFAAYSGVGSMYRDGKRYQSNVFDGTVEPYGLERVEVLKGAASLLYGASAPGGIINSVTKRPTQEPIREITVELGSFDRKQLSADFSGALSDDVSYRLTLLQRDADTFIDGVADNRTYIAPALHWQLSEQTKFTFLSYYQKSESAYMSSLPPEGTILANPNGSIASSSNLGEPDLDKVATENISLSYIVNHEFTDKLSLNHSFNYFDNNGSFNYTTVWEDFIDDEKRVVNRRFQERDEESNGYTADVHLNYQLIGDNIAHKITLGIDLNEYNFKTFRYNNALADIDVFNPIYSGVSGGEHEPSGWSSNDEIKRASIYVQDQVNYQQWIFVAGLRYESIKDDYSDLFPTTVYPTDIDKALTGNAGIVYIADNGLAPFISYSQSFEPQWDYDVDGNRFDPTEGEQFEVGIRYQPDNQDILLSATVYQLSQTNVAVTHNDVSVNTGEVISNGVELEVKGRISDELQITSAYTYTDARGEEDERTDGVPCHQFSLWADYQFSLFNLPGLNVGAGLRYTEETLTYGVEGDPRVPSSTLIDAMVSYQTPSWRYALNVTNLTDKNYITGCSWGCVYGEPRKIIASVNYNF